MLLTYKMCDNMKTSHGFSTRQTFRTDTCPLLRNGRSQTNNCLVQTYTSTVLYNTVFTLLFQVSQIASIMVEIFFDWIDFSYGVKNHNIEWSMNLFTLSFCSYNVTKIEIAIKFFKKQFLYIFVKFY